MNRNGRDRGFSLIELMIAMVIFLIIFAAALGLYTQDLPVYSEQQGQAGLNIAIRNTVAQLQMDVVNGGAGYYPPGTTFPVAPVGLSILNNWVTPGGAPCNTPATYTYGPNCFDTLNVITTDPTAPASHPDNGTFATPCSSTTDNVDTSTATTIYLYPPASTTAATLAAKYHTGDQILLVTTGGDNYTTTTITATPTTYTNNGVTGVKLSINTTDAGGVKGANTASNDLLGITWDPTNQKLNSSFSCADWVTRLVPITYSVNTANPSDPQLQRTTGLGATATTTVLADQIIGFKVGADIWDLTSSGCIDSSVSVDTTCFDYNNHDYANDFTLVRAVQISLIGRTNPDPGPNYTYRNGFDGGPYQIEGVSVEINPRNMSMNNN